MMIYTKSVDGVPRATMKIDARLTREEYRDYNLQAKRIGYKNLREFMTIYLMCWHDNLDGWVSEFEEMG
jgi:hypothetical protein